MLWKKFAASITMGEMVHLCEFCAQSSLRVTFFCDTSLSLIILSYTFSSLSRRHTCKISYLTSQGRTIAVAFGSTESPDLKQLRATIRYCIKLVIKYTNKKRKQSNVDNQENCNDTVDGGSTITGTELSAGYSAVASEFSNTVYGRNTMTPSTLNWVEANK